MLGFRMYDGLQLTLAAVDLDLRSCGSLLGSASRPLPLGGGLFICGLGVESAGFARAGAGAPSGVASGRAEPVVVDFSTHVPASNTTRKSVRLTYLTDWELFGNDGWGA